MGNDAVRGSNIQFKFRKALNLRRKNGDAPNAAVYAKYITDETGKKGKTDRTALRKSHNPVWDENINMNMQRDSKVSMDTKVTFIVVDLPNPLLPLSYTKIARSKPYTVSELLSLRDAKEASKEGEEGFAVALDQDVVASTTQTNQQPPTLILSLQDFWSVDDKKKFHEQVKAQWKTRNQQDLNVEIDNLRREFMALSADLPTGINEKTIVDIALGALSLLVNVGSLPEIHEDRTVVSLISAQCDSFKKIREKGPHHSPDTVIKLYGQICSKIIASLRSLSYLTANGLKLGPARSALTAEASKDTKWFDDFAGTEVKSEGSNGVTPLSRDVSAARANRRSQLTASQPDITTKLRPLSDMDAPQLGTGQAKNATSASNATQLVASWTLGVPMIEAPRVLWLYGGENTGKSVFAGRIVEAFEGLDAGSPAYFSFSGPPDGESDKANEGVHGLHTMVATLAFQLAAYNEGLESGISNTVKHCPALEGMSFEDAFKRLVLDPLSMASNAQQHENADGKSRSTSSRKNAIIIILDDIEQCTPQDLDKLLKALVESLDNLPKNVKILLLSRDVSSIREALEGHRLASSCEFTSQGGEGTPMSPIFSPVRLSFGLNSNGNGEGSMSRSSSIKWSSNEPLRKDSGGGSKGKRRSGGSVTSLGGISELEIGDPGKVEGTKSS
ncbi:hypothetical protein CC2G_008620 [Coprinopsis cinerea AmutBmut pab1-1]|nr:hypothetical protein CC2G_008620 [Coprinopsis cinerea AmutBmut pab1-1]